MNSIGHPKAVILGGTGHIGSAIARRFHAAGFAVVATGQRQIERPNLRDTGVTIVTGDDADAANLHSWITGASVVVDCATPYPVWMYERSGRDKADAAMARTRSIIAAVDQAGAHLVLISSFTTLDRRESLGAAMRRGALQGAHPYFDLKKNVEHEVRNYLGAGGRGAIIAPSTCFGPYDLKPRSQAFVPLLLSGEIPVLANQELNIVDVRDVAEVAFAAAGTNSKTPIPVFGHNIALRDLARRLCQIKGVAAPNLTVPTAFGVAGLYWMETACALVGRSTPWPSLSMLLLAASYPADPSHMQLQLHPSLRPLDQTLGDAVDWYDGLGLIGTPRH